MLQPISSKVQEENLKNIGSVFPSLNPSLSWPSAAENNKHFPLITISFQRNFEPYLAAAINLKVQSVSKNSVILPL